MTLINSTKFLLLFIFLLLSMNAQAVVTYNVVDLGADPKGVTDSTTAFQNAWSKACGSAEPAGLYVPIGTFLLKATQFGGPCKNGPILIQITGTLIAPTDYNVLGSTDSWIKIEQVNGVSVEGGVLDGRGKGLWDCKGSGKTCPHGAHSFRINDSKNVNVASLTSRDSQMFHIVIYGSQNVKLERVTVTALGGSPNTDGIHIEASSFVSIFRSNISTGDDCVSIGPGSSSLWIENVSCGPGHGISIGSLGKVPNQGVHNVTVTTASFTGTQNGVRIKTWGRPSNSFIRDVVFQHATMNNVRNPIIINQHYCDGACGSQPSGVQISRITYSDIHGSSATQVAVKFDCSESNPCTGLTLENINLNYNGKTAQATCGNASGKTSGTVNPPSCLKME